MHSKRSGCHLADADRRKRRGRRAVKTSRFWKQARGRRDRHAPRPGSPHAQTSVRPHSAGWHVRAARLADGMRFEFLYDRRRRMFTIGYRLADAEGPGRADGSFYDLLASEARLASFVAIAKGDVPQHHWFHLGRLVTSIDGRATLMSWGGTMFEYLMPLLLMRSFPGHAPRSELPREHQAADRIRTAARGAVGCVRVGIRGHRSRRARISTRRSASRGWG